MTTPPQIFKSRKAAHDWLVEEGAAVSRGKFYEDCTRLHMVQADKTVRLADLLGYIKEELKINLATGQSIGDISNAREKEQWEIRKLKADVELKEKANRKEDRRWMLRSESEDHEAAMVGLLRDALRHRVRIQATSLLRTAGGSPSREPEFVQALLALVDDGFNDLEDASEFDVEFEEEEFFDEVETSEEEEDG